ncbi:MAG: hypothetical protein BMS9Abin02_1740 [Anaerolineae bacterium]|nr:MAG: hypothetical protein BMS9Abin02_1740 [Anaerolineae bacterium]
MIEIPIDAEVLCLDGPAGRSSHVIIDPTQKTVTHFVVKREEVAGSENWIVPIEFITKSTHDSIYLKLSLDELQGMPQFSEMHWLEADRDEPGYPADAIYLAPYVTPLRTEGIPIETERIPRGEIAIRRGAFVEARDGLVGTVGEFLIDPDSGQISHIVLQEGHLWGKQEIAIPLSAVDEALESTVYLKMDREDLKALPGIPLKRHYNKEGEPRGLELVTKLFKDPKGASAALKNLKGRKDIRIRNAAIVVKDAEGKAKIKETADVDATRGGLAGAVAGGLIGLVGGPVGVVVGALVGAGTGGFAAKKIDTGFSNAFLEKYQEYVEPDSSALIVLVEGKTAQQLSDVLAEVDGIVLRHSLSKRMVEEMASTWEGSAANAGANAGANTAVDTAADIAASDREDRLSDEVED